MRKFICLFYVAALLFCLCSCGERSAVTFYGNAVFFTKGGFVAEVDNKYYIYTDINKQPMDFIIDPLSTEESVANVLCTDGQKVYYENENSEIICRDMVSYEEKVFFQPSVNSGISLLGLTDAVTNQVEDGSGFYDITAMYIDSSGDAYIVCNNQLCKLDGGKIIPILKNYIYTLCYDGNKVYFVDIARDFFVCDSNGSNLRKLIDAKVSANFSVIKDRIWYQPLKDLNSIYSCALDGNKSRIEAAESDGVNSFRVDEKYIYYTDAENRYLHRLSIGSSEPETLLEQTVVQFNLVPETDKLILSVSDENGVVKTVIY